MLWCASWDLGDNASGLQGALFRYPLLSRVAKAATDRDCQLRAWGFARGGLRLVLEGNDEDRLASACRAAAIGTSLSLRAAGFKRCGAMERVPLDELLDAVVWAHLGPVELGAGCPLGSPWSSHRDLLAFRRAPFVDVAALRLRIDADEVHARCGGDPLPAGWPPPAGQPEDLTVLLRIASGVLGVMPANRRCFRLFVHLALARGWSVPSCAEALALTQRRVRQLAQAEEPDLPLALLTLSDPRLCRVP